MLESNPALTFGVASHFFHPIVKCEVGEGCSLLLKSGNEMIEKGEVRKENGLDNWNATESPILPILCEICMYGIENLP